MIDSDHVLPIYLMNDLYTTWQGSVRLRIIRNGKTVIEQTQPCKVAELGATRISSSQRARLQGRYKG